MPHTPVMDLLRRLTSAPQARRPVAVFDLDSTLFDTAPRHLAIVREFAQTQPAIAPFVEKLDGVGWNIIDDLRRAGLADEALITALKGFWQERFFTDKYVVMDAPYPGAVDFVRAFAEAGVLIYYLTGRDEPNMKQGTEEALRRNAFPLADAMLRLKPRYEDEDLAFKQAVIADLKQLGEVVLLVENEPANANLFAEHFPEALVLLHQTIHSPSPPPLLPAVKTLPHMQLPASSFARPHGQA